MYNKLYDIMVPRVGPKAAQTALTQQYANLILIVAGLICVAISWLGGSRSNLILCTVFVLLLLATAYNVYARVKFAGALSEYLDVEVNWYQVPGFARMKLFDKWLDDLKKSSKQQDSKPRS
jgi:hypothetical protein